MNRNKKVPGVGAGNVLPVTLVKREVDGEASTALERVRRDLNDATVTSINNARKEKKATGQADTVENRESDDGLTFAGWLF